MPDFSKIWAISSPLPEFNFTDEEYATGWDFVAAAPPTKNQFDAWFRQTDEKLKWLYDKLNDTANAIYPVGSVYISFVSTSPASLFGGVWTRLKDTFLLANGDAYAPDTTGGSATKTITVNNMPAHNHTVNAAGNHTHTATTSTNGNHNHTRGSMNITGTIGGDDLSAMHSKISGAFYHSYDYSTNDGIGNEDNVVNGVYGFNASRTWSGATSTNGNHNHTLTTTTNGNHTHTTNDTGGSTPINIMPPYTTVYMWRRTA